MSTTVLIHEPTCLYCGHTPDPWRLHTSGQHPVLDKLRGKDVKEALLILDQEPWDSTILFPRDALVQLLQETKTGGRVELI